MGGGGDRVRGGVGEGGRVLFSSCDQVQMKLTQLELNSVRLVTSAECIGEGGGRGEGGGGREGWRKGGMEGERDGCREGGGMEGGVGREGGGGGRRGRRGEG